jgi:hypothetical protein
VGIVQKRDSGGEGTVPVRKTKGERHGQRSLHSSSSWALSRVGLLLKHKHGTAVSSIKTYSLILTQFEVLLSAFAPLLAQFEVFAIAVHVYPIAGPSEFAMGPPTDVMSSGRTVKRSGEVHVAGRRVDQTR